MLKKTKIIATIGPSSKELNILEKMVESGMDIIRINSAHGDIEQYKNIIKNINELNKRITYKKISVLLDVKGPEIRIISDKKYDLKYNDIIEIFFPTNSMKSKKKDTMKMPIFNHFFKSQTGNKILVNDGLYELEIIKKNKNSIVLKALMNLQITNKLRVNIPGVEYDSEILSENDKKVILELKNEFDFLALSYVRNKNDLINARNFLNKNNIDVKIISKIENIAAVNNFDEILEYSDAIMVARGDLGVELKHEKVPIIQKEIIKKCNQKGKAVITATQMLQTMVENPVPTRAETSDVANSILDGTDAIMLSAESATGKFPINAVKEMTKIAKEVEPYVKSNVVLEKTENISEATAKSISEITKLLNIKKVIALTHTGFTAKMLSRFRLKQPIYAICNEKIAKELILYYGVEPFIFNNGLENMKNFINTLINQKRLLKEDLILIASGTKPNETNLIEINYVHEILNKN
ncbi:MAG: pyruvate kinase [Candidatus Woesearchaeota archaeon]